MFKTQTFSSIRYSLGERNGRVFIDVEAYFDPTESWVVRGSRSEYLLQHEQLHFDITELHARKLRKLLQDHQGMESRKFREKRLWHWVNEKHEEVYQEMVAMQDQYDKETDHSLISSRQKEWESRINKALDDHIEFTSP